VPFENRYYEYVHTIYLFIYSREEKDYDYYYYSNIKKGGYPIQERPTSASLTVCLKGRDFTIGIGVKSSMVPAVTSSKEPTSASQDSAS